MIRRFKEEKGRRAIYHCFTRSVAGALLFDDKDKEFLRSQMWKVAEFSGVRVLTYCLLGNHFHVLVEILDNEPPAADQELVRRYRVLYPQGDRQNRLGLPAVLEKKLAQGGIEADEIRRGLRRRMGDVSAFMGLLKQRFSVWYNGTNKRFGTLWAERFKSVLVDGESPQSGKPGGIWQTVAAYVDLNPVRAGLVDTPEDYRWSGYAEAVGGGRLARAGIVRLFGLPWPQAMAAYRQCLYGSGAIPRPGKSAIDVATARSVLERRGELTVAEALRHRLSYFSEGLAVGSQSFVEGQLDRYRRLTQRRMKYRLRRWVLGQPTIDWMEVFTVRGKQTEAFGT